MYSARDEVDMLGDISGVTRIYLVFGYTDMRKSINGLMEIVRDMYSNSLFLFCGRKSDRIKALHFERDGFVLLYKVLDKNCGRFRWPRNSKEARSLTRQEFKWLLEGLSIDQPRAIKQLPNLWSPFFFCAKCQMADSPKPFKYCTITAS